MSRRTIVYEEGFFGSLDSASIALDLEGKSVTVDLPAQFRADEVGRGGKGQPDDCEDRQHRGDCERSCACPEPRIIANVAQIRRERFRRTIGRMFYSAPNSVRNRRAIF